VIAAGMSAVAFEAPTGRVLWTFAPGQVAGLGTIAVDAGAVYLGTDVSHRVYALDVGTGRQRWSTDIGPEWSLGGTVWGVSLSGDTVYAGATQYRSVNTYLRSGWIVALDRTTGAILWRVSSGAGDTLRSVQSAPTIAGRFAVASDHMGNTFFAVDRFAAREVWRVPGDSTFAGPMNSPIVSGDTVFVASPDRFLYAADLTTGHLLWKRQVSVGSINAYARCGPAIGLQALALLLVTQSTGDPLAKLIDGDPEHITSALMASGDTLFATSTTTAYAVDCRP
jgi:outer membrane protein assembly factor BamB